MNSSSSRDPRTAQPWWLYVLLAVIFVALVAAAVAVARRGYVQSAYPTWAHEYV